MSDVSKLRDNLVTELGLEVGCPESKSRSSWSPARDSESPRELRISLMSQQGERASYSPGHSVRGAFASRKIRNAKRREKR